MGYHCFDVEINDRIAHVRMMRGDQLNTMVPEFWAELPAIIQDIDDNARARAVVMSSTGKHFSAGLDVAAFARSNNDTASVENEPGRLRAQLRARMRGLQDAFSVLEHARMPVLAAIQGGCVGAGLDLASACDCLYATDDAFFVIQQINIGMTATEGIFPRLCKLMPLGQVRELAYSGRRLPAKEAFALGLVNRLFPSHPEMLDGVLALARQMAEKSPLAVYGSKVLINHSRDHGVHESLDYVATWQAAMHYPESDVKESLTAKAEGRPARYAELPPVRPGFGRSGGG